MTLLKIYQGRALQTALSEVVKPVQISYQALDQPEPDTLEALAELDKLTPYLLLDIHQTPAEAADRVIVQGEQGGQLVFVGPPVGTELAALVSAIIIAGRGKSGLTAATRQALAGLQTRVQLVVFTTPT